jgi:molybdenum cofactor synthesis domain-containing protein
MGKIVSLNISREKGTIKEPVSTAMFNELGVQDDAHAGLWHRQVSILSKESVDKFSKAESARDFKFGEFAENITTEGIDLSKVSILDRFTSGDVVLEVTQIGKKCHGDGCSIYREVGKCVMPKEGLFARVISGGAIKCGDSVDHIPYKLKCKVITMSDRASKGEYKDLSGPRVSALFSEFFKNTRWNSEVSNVLIPDDEVKLKSELEKAISEKVDVVITTGGTGVGPRDITPEVVTSMCTKHLPGIMENIRLKFGQAKPNALLSRSVAGMMKSSQVYALPGSVRAVNEYMGEILKTVEHLILMVNGIGH